MAFYLNYDEILNKGLEVYVKEHLSEYYDIFFFDKLDDWKDEWEYRWLLISNNSGYEYVNYDDSLKAVILGIDFPLENEIFILEYCKKLGIPAFRMNWQNGRPAKGLLYDPETGKIRINKRHQN